MLRRAIIATMGPILRVCRVPGERRAARAAGPIPVPPISVVFSIELKMPPCSPDELQLEARPERRAAMRLKDFADSILNQ
jgi:hypothetical protein